MLWWRRCSLKGIHRHLRGWEPCHPDSDDEAGCSRSSCAHREVRRRSIPRFFRPPVAADGTHDMDFHIFPERPDDAVLIDPLLDRAFGFDRKSRTVYRLREGITPLPELCFSAVHPDGSLLASLRFWPILIDDVPAILLGPLAVEPDQQ